MAEAVGRSTTLGISPDGVAAYVTIASVKTKNFTVGNELIDITTDDSAGNRTLLAKVGTKTVDFSCSGVAKDEVLLAASMVTAELNALLFMEMTLASGSTLTGTFALSNFSQDFDNADADTFSCDFQSSGAVVYVAA